MWKRLATISIAVVAAACGGDGGDDDGRDVIALHGDELYPAGITAAADGTLFVGSVREGTIERIRPGAATADPQPFVPAPLDRFDSVLGLFADGDRLLACYSNIGLSRLPGTLAPPGLTWFDRETGARLGGAELPSEPGTSRSVCKDIARDDRGNIYITDSDMSRILILRAGEATVDVWLRSSLFLDINGIEVLGGAVYVTKFNPGTLFRISFESDGRAGAVTEIALGGPLEQPDGLRAHGADLVVVERAGRLSRIALGAGDTGAITPLRDGLDRPTTAVIVDGKAWVVESQLQHLLDPTTGPPNLPFQVKAIALDN